MVILIAAGFLRLALVNIGCVVVFSLAHISWELMLVADLCCVCVSQVLLSDGVWSLIALFDCAFYGKEDLVHSTPLDSKVGCFLCRCSIDIGNLG